MYKSATSYETCTSCANIIDKEQIYSCQCCDQTVLCQSCMHKYHTTQCACNERVSCHLHKCDQHVSMTCTECQIKLCQNCIRKCVCCAGFYCLKCYQHNHQMKCMCGNLSICHIKECGTHEKTTCPDCKGKLCYACKKLYCACCFEYYCTKCYFKNHYESCDCDPKNIIPCHKPGCPNKDHQRACQKCPTKLCSKCMQDCSCVQASLCRKCYDKNHPDTCHCGKMSAFQPDCVTYHKKIQKQKACEDEDCYSKAHTFTVLPVCKISDCQYATYRNNGTFTICCVHEKEYNLSNIKTCHTCMKQYCFANQHAYQCDLCNYYFCLRDVGFWQIYDNTKKQVVIPTCPPCESYIFINLEQYLFKVLVNIVKDYLYEVPAKDPPKKGRKKPIKIV
jgi:hypothetical protein